MSKIAKTQCVHADEKTGRGAICGLSWSPLGAYKTKRQGKELRELAEMRDAKKYCLAKVVEQDGEEGAYVGFLPQSYVDSGDMQYVPKKMYSMAKILATRFVSANVILAWRLMDKQDEDHYALIVLAHGEPVLDQVCSLEDARKIANEYFTGAIGDGNFSLYSNYERDFDGADVLTAEMLFSDWPADAKINNIPIDKVKAGLIAAVLCGVVFGQQYTNYYLEEQEKARAIEARKKADKRPVYESELPSAIAAIGVSTPNLIAQVENLFRYPILADGWKLRKVSCRIDNCYSEWEQQGGYREDLKRFLVGHQAQMVLNNDQATTMQFPSVMRASGRTDFSSFLRNDQITDVILREREVWDKAKLKVVSDIYFKTWPEVHGDFGAGFGVQRTPVEFTGSRELLFDFANKYGQHIYWDQLDITINIASETNPLEYKAMGHFYVYQ
jgi:hypothetical protein